MARLEFILALAVTLLFCGCAGAPAPGNMAPAAPAAPTAAQTPTVFGNWQFTASSAGPGKSPLIFSGSIGTAGNAVSGALHVDGSDCFDRLTTIALTATVTAGSTTLTSAAIDGQVVTFTGNFADSTTFNGTFKIDGGCAAGYQGKLTGINVWNIGNNLSGTFTNSAQNTFNVMGKIAQSSSASSDGSFGITGTTTFNNPCLSAGTIQPGTLPTGSFILGMSVSLEAETSNGILTFLGTLNQDGSGEINGNYIVSGGSCDDSGTAVLHVAGEWDY